MHEVMKSRPRQNVTTCDTLIMTVDFYLGMAISEFLIIIIQSGSSIWKQLYF